METKAILGCSYRDRLHGIVGVATARTEYLTGCCRVSLEYVKDGEVKGIAFDEPQLELVEGKDKQPKIGDFYETQRELVEGKPEEEQSKDEKERGGPGAMPSPRGPVR